MRLLFLLSVLTHLGLGAQPVSETGDSILRLPGLEHSDKLYLRFFNFENEEVRDVEVKLLVDGKTWPLAGKYQKMHQCYFYELSEELQQLPFDYNFRLVLTHPDYLEDTVSLNYVAEVYYLFRKDEPWIGFSHRLPYKEARHEFILFSRGGKREIRKWAGQWDWKVKPLNVHHKDYDWTMPIRTQNEYYLKPGRSFDIHEKDSLLKAFWMGGIEFGRAFIHHDYFTGLHSKPVGLLPVLKLSFVPTDTAIPHAANTIEIQTIESVFNGLSVLRQLSTRKPDYPPEFIPEEVYKAISVAGLHKAPAIMEDAKYHRLMYLEYPIDWDVEKIREVVNGLYKSGVFISINPLFIWNRGY